MNNFDKCIVVTQVELDTLRASLPWQSMVLNATEQNGKKFKLTDIFGHKAVEKGKTDPVNGATYTIRQEITNPEHADYGKFFIRVNSADVNTYVPAYAPRMVNEDPTWRV